MFYMNVYSFLPIHAKVYPPATPKKLENGFLENVIEHLYWCGRKIEPWHDHAFSLLAAYRILYRNRWNPFTGIAALSDLRRILYLFGN